MNGPSVDELNQLAQTAQAQLEESQSADELESWRVEYIGRKGKVPQLLRGLKELSPEDKKILGPKANQLRKSLEDLFKKKQSEITAKNTPRPERGEGQGARVVEGHIHPSMLSIRRVTEIMAAMGFTIVEGPEVEQEYYDFDALNIPLTHPSRAESDSFYVSPRAPRGDGRVLRSSTSAVQVRSVIEQDLVPPFAIASPGRVFRNEKPDATHESTFHQVEALVVGENVTIADYKGLTETLFSTYFNQKANIRLRPGYFPFVEPGFEVDMSCVFCQSGCRVCKNTKWIEMGGAGMVHPNVLRNMSIDPHKYQGFAWGYGTDRFTLLQHEITDLRLLWSGDYRFLKQFS